MRDSSPCLVDQRQPDLTKGPAHSPSCCAPLLCRAEPVARRGTSPVSALQAGTSPGYRPWEKAEPASQFLPPLKPARTCLSHPTVRKPLELPLAALGPATPSVCGFKLHVCPLRDGRMFQAVHVRAGHQRRSSARTHTTAHLTATGATALLQTGSTPPMGTGLQGPGLVCHIHWSLWCQLQTTAPCPQPLARHSANSSPCAPPEYNRSDGTALVLDG